MIKVGNIKFRCTEGLFNPGLYGKDETPLHNMIERSIKACEIDHRRMLCKNIYLSGGTSMLPGLYPHIIVLYIFFGVPSSPLYCYYTITLLLLFSNG